MTDQPHSHEPTPSPGEPRERPEHTRDEFGRRIEALAGAAGEADVTARAQEVAAEAQDKAVTAKEQAVRKAALVTDQIRDTAEQAARLVKDTTPDAVRDQAAQASRLVGQATARAGRFAAENTPEPVLDRAGQAAAVARANRTPLLAAGAFLVVFLLVRRGRGRK
ncbi:hypothetical protein [Streptomyces sp. NPDC002044]|uniref:hypothetical protein n=1 Tax=Streptomyces sp. NPDC002044 TaxID=3154662 RepID=UPI003327519F